METQGYEGAKSDREHYRNTINMPESAKEQENDEP